MHTTLLIILLGGGLESGAEETAFPFLEVGLAVALLVLVILVVALTLLMRHKKENVLRIPAERNSAYGLYEIHPDPIAEVVDTNEAYFEREDSMLEGASRVTDNNENYSAPHAVANRSGDNNIDDDSNPYATLMTN